MSILKIERLTKEYKGFWGKRILAVNNVDLEVEQGEVLGLLGPNGAGKTTIIKMICGLVNPTRGNISIGGYNIIKERRNAIKAIGAVLEGSRNVYLRLTPYENLRYFGNIRGKTTKEIKKRIDELLHFFNLYERRNELTQKLSRGMQQKLSIGVALITDPSLLLLDEPTLGLDPHSSKELQEMIIKIAKGERKTILIATHQMEVAQTICNRIAIINKGRIIVCDEIERLLTLFYVSHYEFKIPGILDIECKEKLNKIPYLEIKENGSETCLSVNIKDSKDFYEIIELLKSYNVCIAEINKKEVDLEKIYFQLVDR
ncbi:MAG: ABC transporter ATP-binding protein [bacterium]